MQTQIIQAAEQVVVSNYFSNQRKDEHLSWLMAILHAFQGSAHVYGRKLELLAYNNRWGTLTNATAADLSNVHSVFSYLRRFYVSTDPALDAILNTHRHQIPSVFSLQMLDSRRFVSGRVWPVIIDGRLVGVVSSSGFEEYGEAGDQRQRFGLCKQL